MLSTSYKNTFFAITLGFQAPKPNLKIKDCPVIQFWIIPSYLKFFQYFVRFPPVLAKVFNLLALGTASIVLHFSALGVQFGALGLVAHRPVLGAHARTVRVSRVEALPEFVDEATVVHASFAPVVVEDDVVAGGSLRLVGGVILGVTHRGRGHGAQGQQEDRGGREERAHPSQWHRRPTFNKTAWMSSPGPPPYPSCASLSSSSSSLEEIGCSGGKTGDDG